MLISLALWGAHAHALGLGAIALQSGLARPLQASIPVYGLAADDAGARCLKTRVLGLDGSLLARPSAELAGSGAAAVLTLRSVESINEPAVNVLVEIGCANPIKREYQVLLDPLPLGQQQAAPVVPTARPASAQRAAPPQADSAATTTAAAAGIAPKRPARVRPKPAAAPESVLTLTSGNAENAQVRSNLALRHATTLSEPRLETDPAKLEAMRADQARVAALLRGESPLANALALSREAQGKLESAQKLASEATRRYAQETATAATAAAEREHMVSSNWVAVLAALLLACLAAIGWLLWCRADDRRRHEQAFFTMAAEPEAPYTPAPAFEPAPPLFVPAAEMPRAQFTTFAAEAGAPVPPGHDWGADPITLPVATSPPEPVEIPASWLMIETQIDELRDQSPPNAGLAPHAASLDEKAQGHAAEVAGLLLAAESWMAEHNPLRAAELLRSYLGRNDMLSPAPGLYLLSLYRTMDDQAQMQTVQAQLKQHFPVEAADWSNPVRARRSIADFPLVHAVVDSLSETDKLLPYLNSLLLAPERFDFSTYREIVRAIRLANEMKQESDIQSMSFDFQ